MKRTLVTGATGFVGTNLVRRLLADGHKVHVLCRPESNYWRLEDIHQDIETHKASLSDKDALSQCLNIIKPEQVFHLAANGAYSWQNDLDSIISTNVTGIANLLACLANSGCESFVTAGSSSEYGYKDHAPKEEEWLDPNSEYAIAKAAATHFCRLYAQKHGLNTTVLRLYSAYGPYEDKDRLIPTMIDHGLQKKLPPLVNPDIARDFIYIDDAIDAFIAAAAAKNIEPGAVYNLGTGKQTTLREVVDLTRKVFNISDEPQWGSMPNRKWDTCVWIADINKISKSLNWQPKHTFEEGFLKTIKWSRKNLELPPVTLGSAIQSATLH